MVSDLHDTLHEFTEVAVIRHRDLGVLLLHSHRWIKDPSELEGMELYHSLIADIIRRAPGNVPERIPWLDPSRTD